MSDIFSHEEVKNLLSHKKVVIIGDSNMRGLYKDIVCLLNKNELLSAADLRAKLEPSFLNDKLVYKCLPKNERDHKEERQFCNDHNHHRVDFFYVTRCYDKYLDEKIIKKFQENQPDVVIMNSCYWDIMRWGTNSVVDYKANLCKLMKRLKETLGKKCLFIWTTALPISQDVEAGLLISEVEFARYQLRFELMEANFFAWRTVTANNFDVLDLHYYMQMNITRRVSDGIHWINTATRHVTNYVLTHIALAWGVTLPGRIKNKELEFMSKNPICPEFPADNVGQEPPKENAQKAIRKVLRPLRRRNDRR